MAVAPEQSWAPPAPPGTAPREGIPEAAALWWRREVGRGWLRRKEWLWTMWTVGIVITFAAPAVLLLLEPWTFPVVAISFAHGILITRLSAGRGWRSVVPIDSQRSASRRRDVDDAAERVAVGLLGDLLGPSERELALETGLALQRGELGVWLLGEAGAVLVRPGGRRVDCWCVRIAEPGGLPGGDRVAHLLLALREDERGFATVANMGFSGAAWRLRGRIPVRSRKALDVARREARAERHS